MKDFITDLIIWSIIILGIALPVIGVIYGLKVGGVI